MHFVVCDWIANRVAECERLGISTRLDVATFWRFFFYHTHRVCSAHCTQWFLSFALTQWHNATARIIMWVSVLFCSVLLQLAIYYRVPFCCVAIVNSDNKRHTHSTPMHYFIIKIMTNEKKLKLKDTKTLSACRFPCVNLSKLQKKTLKRTIPRRTFWFVNMCILLARVHRSYLEKQRWKKCNWIYDYLCCRLTGVWMEFIEVFVEFPSVETLEEKKWNELRFGCELCNANCFKHYVRFIVREGICLSR